MKILNNDWEYVEKWSTEFLHGGQAEEIVRIPHTVKIVPLHCVDSESYQMTVGYRKKILIPASEKGKRQFLQFDGAAHIATVYINGKEACVHRNGYTAFRVEITNDIQYDAENTITVKLETDENSTIPPFGYVIDYLTFGGIYRDVKLDTRPQVYIEDAFVSTPNLHTVCVKLQIDGYSQEDVDITIFDDNRKVIAKSKGKQGDTIISCSQVEAWTCENPKLYTCHIELNGKEKDVQDIEFGFRTITLDENNILLNGKPYFLRGLNRHQCYPYVGYAVPKTLQIEDARILKEELQVNAVRTSHYPQSQDFIQACDRLGLLVFTEIPGWQHIGDENWKQQAIENTKEMILQYRNHPSIFIWGVRINESLDDDAFYQKTNEVAHSLDPTRPTSGVRYLENSSLLEDVYGYNDFSHEGNNPGCKKKEDVTKKQKPLLITECNGHMFPTKSYDRWERRQEQALRHERVMDAAMADHKHAGIFGWCMFDYPTHREFGSGDRICYHGVMDSFRNPKLAAAAYASQGKQTILEIGSPMEIGDYDGGRLSEIYVFTNADEVRVYKNDEFVKAFQPKGWQGISHGAICIDDMIGEVLETKENMHGTKEKYVHDALLQAQKNGFAHMPLKAMMELAWCMVRYKMKYEEGVELYGKYVGGWGGGLTTWRFEAICNGKVEQVVTKKSNTKLHLEVKPSATTLYEGDTYDMASFRIRILDEENNLMSYAQLPATITIEGPIEIVGPSVVNAEGGMCGTYIRTIGKHGEAFINIHTDQTEDIRIPLQIMGRE